jgi:hypothetical protein
MVPESPERDAQELELRLSTVRMLWAARGYGAQETSEATQRAAVLAEKCGNLKQLMNLMAARVLVAYNSGDLSVARPVADEALALAFREGSARSRAIAYALQIETRHSQGDLAGVEQQFTVGLRFFSDPDFRRISGGAVAAFGYAAWNAWLCGWPELAWERGRQMMAAIAQDNPHDLAWSNMFAAQFQLYLREYG